MLAGSLTAFADEGRELTTVFRSQEPSHQGSALASALVSPSSGRFPRKMRRNIRLEGDDFWTAVAGDGLYYIVRWLPDGSQKVLGTHQYGNDMTNANSPHFLDQAEDYANEVLHEPLYDETSRAGRLSRTYTVTSGN